MWLELLNLILGIVFGFYHHGKEDYNGLLKNGAIAGLLLGIIFVLAALYLVPGSTSIDVGFLGVFGIFIGIIIFLIIFIVGVFIGDKVESIRKK
jgi:Na+/proline symporter